MTTTQTRGSKPAMTAKRAIALLLAMVLVLCLLPAAALAASGHKLTVKASAPKTEEMTAGALLEVPMTDIFDASGCADATYSLGGDYGANTSVKPDKDGNWTLYFTQGEARDYSVVLNAVCGSDASVSATHTLTVTVKAAAAGSEAQYNYDETPAKSVTVYVTVSNDGIPLQGNDPDKTALSHLKVTVPYFDLKDYGLERFHRYHTADGKGPYVDETVVERPTLLHLYIYLLQKYCMNKPTTPENNPQKYPLSGRINYMNGTEAYSVKDGFALNATQTATSMYMTSFWGRDENLMYYRNHVYPLMGPGWGSTADYILLSDNDTIDLAMFTDRSFYTRGAFTNFDKDEYTVKAGSSLTFQTLKYDTKSVSDGGTEQFEPISGLDTRVYDENWNEVALLAEQDSKGHYSYTFRKAGTYYLLAVDPLAGKENACYAPATAKVTVTANDAPAFDPATAYKDYNFSSIYYLDGDTQKYLVDIKQDDLDWENYTGSGTLKTNQVTVLKGTENVYVEYPNHLSFAEYIGTYDVEDRTTEYSDSIVWTTNEDGTHTVTIPVADYANGTGVLVEGSDYKYFEGFDFIYGTPTDPTAGSGDGPVVPTGVSLDQTKLTLNRRDTQQLKATISPANVDNQRVTWSTANEKIAAVDQKGLVTAFGVGTTTITVTTNAGGKTATCEVTVIDNSKPTQDDDGYYLIGTASQLSWFRDEVNNGSSKLNARLTANIDLSDVCGEALAVSWQPIGDQSYNPTGAYGKNAYYAGTFDGQGYTISNLYLSEYAPGDEYKASDHYGRALFGYCKGATVKNLTVTGSVETNNHYASGVVGYAQNNSLIENCHNKANVTCTGTGLQWGLAGVVGYLYNSTAKNCSNTGVIHGVNGQVGGIVGLASSTVHIEGCANTGEVVVTDKYNTYLGGGGIVGCVSGTAELLNCYNTGNVQSTVPGNYAGGIVGYNTGTLTVQKCYSTGSITDFGTLGGILGGSKGGTATVGQSYYLEDSAPDANANGASKLPAEQMHAKDFALGLGSAWKVSCPWPVLSWQEAVAHTGDTICSVCGAQLANGNSLPRLKDGVPDTVALGWDTTAAYTVDLNEIFMDPDGDTMTFLLSLDGGDSQSTDASYSALMTAGVHTLTFRANDGKGTSYAAYVVTLTVTPVQIEGIYQLATKEDLFWFRDTVNGGQYALNAAMTEDIDLADTGDWVRIAINSNNYSSRAYSGTFDGQNHTIKNLSLKNTSSSGKYLALFERVLENGKICNLKLENVQIAGNQYVAAFVAQNAGTVENCHIVSGKVSESTNYYGYCGGICAEASSTSKITGCSNAAEITGAGNYLGGIAATNAGEITGCTNTGRIASTRTYQSQTGGIAGRNGKLIDRCANTGEIYAESARVGGIAGDTIQNSSKVTNSWNGGSVTLNVRVSSDLLQVGGIMGYTRGTVENCYSTGAVIVTADSADGTTVGSIVGKADSTKAAVTNCYASIAAPFGQAVGSVSTGTITNCYYAGEEDAFDGTTVKTLDEMKQSAFAALLGAAFKSGCQSLPVLQWQEAAPHTEVEIPAVPATCTATGLTAGKKCSVCQTVLEEQKTTEKLPHTEEIIPAVPATCTATGLTEGKKCSVCQTILEEQKTVEKLPHTIEILPAVAPTYSSTGLTEGKKCSVCNEILVEQQVVPKLTHPTPVTPVTPSKPSVPKDETPTASSFTDVASGSWYEEAVHYVTEKGLMNGTSSNSFGSNASTTRGMIVTILARCEDVSTSGSPWYAAGQKWAMQNGISDGTNMSGVITREQLAAILYRYAMLKGYKVTNSTALTAFSDADKVSSYAVEAMQWAVAEGLLQGSNGKLNPQGTATRAQVAAILMRFMEKIAK